jgi:hypothetical protein
MARMQPREYTLRATGWVRMVSGIQSLLSVYLLALWVPTYFGRPFERHGHQDEGNHRLMVTLASN